jgi:hypothetical protein
MSHPMIPHDPTNDDLRSRIPRPIPPEIPTPASIVGLVAPHPEELDQRLNGAQLIFLLAGPPPDAQNRLPVPVIPMHGHREKGWQLWRVWLKWPESSVIGEIRFEPGYGWVATPIIRPGDTRREIDRIVHGLAILQRWVPPLGRPPGKRDKRVGPFTDVESFLDHARRQRDHWRRRPMTFTQESLARELGMTEDTFKRGLRKCKPRLTWDPFLDLP